MNDDHNLEIEIILATIKNLKLKIEQLRTKVISGKASFEEGTKYSLYNKRLQEYIDKLSALSLNESANNKAR